MLIVLILMGVLSVMAASLIFVAQTETWSSQNFRLMTQARYGAESAVHQAANYLMNSYVPPSSAGPDYVSSYNATVSPVRCSSSASGCTNSYVPISLSSANAAYSNYPSSATKSAYVTAVHGTLTSGTNSVTYDAVSTLLSLRMITIPGSPTPVAVQTWQILGVGSINGNRPARVDVTAILERQTTPVYSYAAFATFSGCDALGWSGGGQTDSYDSGVGATSVTASGGNVGTNGNLKEAGSPTHVHGSLSTPRTGTGNCTTSSVTAWTVSGNATVDDGLVELPQPVAYPTPTIPAPGAGSLTYNDKAVHDLAPGSYGDITVSAKDTMLRLSSGTYNINSLSFSGNSFLAVNATSGPAVLNLAGLPSIATPLDMTGGILANSSLDPSTLQIQYAGTGEIKLAGGSAGAALVYAPNADIKFVGGGAWWGAVIGKLVDDTGGATIHYDRRLQNSFITLGNFMLDSFGWKKF